MTTAAPTWEMPLIALAQEAWLTLTHAPHSQPGQNAPLIQRAYDHCQAITAEHSRSFHLASSLLPADKRRAARALYAFCRVTDDIVDRPTGDAETALSAWRQRSLDPNPPAHDLVAVAWADARARYHIPRRYAEQLIDGVARDLHQRRYATFADLTTYCYGVASTVGLMSMHIIGFSGPEAIPYAIKLGVALQMTNILRDVAADHANGRIYLPLDELNAHGIHPADLAAGRVTENWRAFMRFQIDRNRQLYAESWTGIALLDADGRFGIAAAADLYRAILDDIEAHDYDVFSRRAHVSAWGKLRRLPGLWWWTRQSGFSTS